MSVNVRIPACLCVRACACWREHIHPSKFVCLCVYLCVCAGTCRCVCIYLLARLFVRLHPTTSPYIRVYVQLLDCGDQLQPTVIRLGNRSPGGQSAHYT